MSRKHGFIENDFVCTCGNHYGVGEQNPEDVATGFAFQRAQLKPYYSPQMKSWLDDYEATHGVISDDEAVKRFRKLRERQIYEEQMKLKSKSKLNYKKPWNY